jgi:uncharacterized sodium:solute symporter family permease YidK
MVYFVFFSLCVSMKNTKSVILVCTLKLLLERSFEVLPDVMVRRLDKRMREIWVLFYLVGHYHICIISARICTGKH